MAKNMGIKAVGIGASDIQQGNKKLILALIWQLMRIHYMQLIGNKTDADVMNWGNSVKGNENRQIKSFGDSALTDGVYLINLCAAVEDRIIDWDLVFQEDPTEEQRAQNAQYAISIARKLGAIIFLVWEDVLEKNKKMLLILSASIYELY